MIKFPKDELDKIVAVVRETAKTKKFQPDEPLKELITDHRFCVPCSWYCIWTEAYRFEYRLTWIGEELLNHPEKFLKE